MGGAIARGLAANLQRLKVVDGIVVSNPSEGKLKALKTEFPDVEVTTDNLQAVSDAGMVILAVKPWLIDRVTGEIRPALRSTIPVVSVAAGVPFSHLQEVLATADGVPSLFRVIPNTAISVGESMSVMASASLLDEDELIVTEAFSLLGKVVKVEERLLDAGMALCSCGTAYALRYIRAAMEAGVELGLYPAQAQMIVAQTVKGAAEMLLRGGAHPEAEIDKVTTPGGFTIKGLNRMEACGFTNAVIEAHKASVKQ